MENQKPQTFNNLTKSKRTALSEKDDIVITKTDKGGAVVIIDVIDQRSRIPIEKQG